MAQTRKTAKKTTTRTTRSKTVPPAAKRSSSTGKKSPSKRSAAAKKAAADSDPDTETSEHPTVTMVRGLAEVVETHSLTELIVDTQELTLTLRRAAASVDLPASTAVALPQAIATQVAAPPVGVPAVPSVPEAQTAAGTAAPSAADAGAESAGRQDDYHIVTSPFVGTFYRRPGPDAVPYIEAGARVEKGQVLCIVEAMKLMNEIESDIAGTVVAILVEDSEPVEYGQSLFKIDPA